MPRRVAAVRLKVPPAVFREPAGPLLACCPRRKQRRGVLEWSGPDDREHFCALAQRTEPVSSSTLYRSAAALPRPSARGLRVVLCAKGASILRPTTTDVDPTPSRRRLRLTAQSSTPPALNSRHDHPLSAAGVARGLARARASCERPLDFIARECTAGSRSSRCTNFAATGPSCRPGRV